MAGIDLSVLYNTSSSSSSTGATQSAVAVYKRLQKTAEENEAKSDESSSSSALDEQIRAMQNAAITARNKVYASDNEQVETDAQYLESLASSGATAEDLLNDDRFLRVVAEANGMGELYRVNKERLKAVLSSDLSDANSAARQGSTHELELAKKFNLGAGGNDGISSSLASSEADAYREAKTKTLLEEIAAPETSETEAYEYDSDEYQIFIKRSDVQRDITYFKENIGNVESVDDLFKDTRLLNFVLSAFDLESESANRGKIRKILESDLSDEDSLANRFSDTRFLKMAQALNIAEDGVSTLTSDSMVNSLVDKYQQLEYERHLDEQAPGVRAAIEFSRRIQDATSTVSLLADSVLREVVTVANAIPKEIAYQETEAQVTAVERKVDLDELKSDPDAVEKMVSRYLVLKDSSSTSSSGSYLLDLFS